MNTRLRKLLFTVCLCLAPMTISALDFELYHSNSMPQWVFSMSAIIDMPIAKDSKVLDVGCGDGKISAYLATRVPEGNVIGLDPSDVALEFATNKYLNADHPNLSFELGRGDDLEYFEQFDLITVFNAVHWFEDYKTAIAKLYKALKPGGRMVLAGPSPIEPEMRKKIQGYVVQTASAKIFSENVKKRKLLHSGSVYAKYAKKVGFHVDVMRIEKTPIVFSGRQELEDWFFSLQPALKQMDEGTLEQYMNDYYGLMEHIYPQAGDGRLYTYPERMELVFSKPV